MYIIKYIYIYIYIFFCFFPIFLLHLPKPLSPRLHCPITTTAPLPCPPCHHYPLPTKISSEQKPIIIKKKKKNPSERQNLEESANHAVTHGDLHQTHHRDPRRSRHDLAEPKHWRSPTTNNSLQPQPNHDLNIGPNHDQQPKHRTQP